MYSFFITKGNKQKALARIAAAYRPNQVKVWLERDKATKYIIVAHLLERAAFFNQQIDITPVSAI